jgi:asparaginyl-tRNA synthetase
MQSPNKPKDETYEGYYGVFSKKKMAALLDVRDAASWAIRLFLREEGFTEVTTATIVNIAGSCENPYASFPLEFYGGEAYLSQSAQLQLEPLVLRLKRRVFTSSMSFRAENYDDPESPGRRLSEFSLAEIEMPFEGLDADEALSRLADLIERFVKFVTKEVMSSQRSALELLGADFDFLSSWVGEPFQRLTWDQAMDLLDSKCHEEEDIGIREERAILRRLRNRPALISRHPDAIKFFNIKRTADRTRCYSVDLLMQPMGEILGGAIREEAVHRLRESLHCSKIAEFLAERGVDVDGPFQIYFDLLQSEPPLLRGGFGLGFERYISCLIGSSDILQAVAHRVLHPRLRR